MEKSTFQNKIISFVSILTFISTLAGCSGSSSSSSGSSLGDNNNNLSPSEAPPARLTLSGTSLLDSNRNPIMLRGFNWGNWGTAQPQDAADNASQGANAVRILLRWWGNYSSPDIDSRSDASPGHIDPAHLALLDSYVSWATSQGLWVDLAVDSNCGQNATQDAAMQRYCDPDRQYGSNGHNFWTDPAMRTEFIEVWQFVANRYKNTTHIAWYEVLPEPNPPSVRQADVTEFYKQVIRAIRTVDGNTPFLVGATSAYNIKRASDAYIPDVEFQNKIIYTGNLFVRTGLSQSANIANLSMRLQGLTDLRDSHNVPIFVQQTGSKSSEDPNNMYLDAVLSLLNSKSVPWVWWEYRDHVSPGGYGIYYPDRDGNWILKPTRLDGVKSYF
jgi:aryl-phospho-beta-D-glucosidase BglC (GH1 family)